LLNVENKKVQLKQIAYDINQNNKIIKENLQKMTQQATDIQFTADVIQKNQTDMQIVIKDIILHEKKMIQDIAFNPIALEKVRIAIPGQFLLNPKDDSIGFWSAILDKILKATLWMIANISNVYSDAQSSAKQWISKRQYSAAESIVIHPVTWVMLCAITGSALKRKVVSFFSTAELNN
jgi:hypothetical protein